MEKFNKFKILFWQPKKDWFKIISSKKYGHIFLLFLNYCLWFFLFYISYLLIKQNISNFWKLFLATIISEVVEKVLKKQKFWHRPIHLNKNVLPNGILKKWYQHGSFPSGHAIKAIFFLVFITQTTISFPVTFFIIIVSILVLSRIILGLHYPIDIFGGIIIGIIIGYFVSQINFPIFLLNFIQPIFNFIFLIK